jgi:hypothetical protein
MHGILEILYNLRFVVFLVLTSFFTHMLAFGYLLLIWPYELNQTEIHNDSAAIQKNLCRKA